MTGDVRYAIGRNVAWRIVEREVFAVTMDGVTHNVCNETGVRIWTALAEGRGQPAEIADALCQEFAVPHPRALRDVRAFLEELSAKGLVESR